MGILEGILGDEAGSPEGRQPSRLDGILKGLSASTHAGSAGLLSAAMSMIQQHGGLTGVRDMLQKSGLAEHAYSWIATGPNQAVTGDQIHKVFGSTAMAGLASRLGMTQSQASSAMAQILPELVNQLTPQGGIGDDHKDVIAQALRKLRGGGE